MNDNQAAFFFVILPLIILNLIVWELYLRTRKKN